MSVDALPEHVRNRRGGVGGLLQLVAHGAADPCFVLYADENRSQARHAYNTRDSMMHWFVERADGFPLAADIPATCVPPPWTGGGILAHVPADQAPRTAVDGSTVPFRVRS